jgi:hypothetical protein
VAILEESIDPLDDDAIFARAKQLGLDAEGCGWLLTLFSPNLDEAVGEQSLDGLAQPVAMAVVVSRAAARLPQA